jgi:hypothetical protein
MKLFEKHPRDPQIISKWSLNFFRVFGNYLRLVFQDKKKRDQPMLKQNSRACLPNTPLSKSQRHKKCHKAVFGKITL